MSKWVPSTVCSLGVCVRISRSAYLAPSTKSVGVPSACTVKACPSKDSVGLGG